MSDPLDEHRAALGKIDATVAQLTAHARAQGGDALACKRGCDSCCVDGLTVLPVEAALIEASGHQPPPQAARREGMCAFLDADGACTIYDVRPVLCRTHGLALKMESAAGADVRERGSLRVLGDDVSACSLNYTTRAPAANEILDATKVMMLLVTVDRRYRARMNVADDVSRVALAEIARRMHARADVT